jgi:hypothetical protein
MKRQRKNAALVSWAVALLTIAAVGLAINLAPRGQAQEGSANEQQPILQYPEFAPTPTIGPAPTTPPALSAAPLYSTGFDDEAALASWEIVDLEPVLPEDKSSWGVEEGRLSQQMTSRPGSPNQQETLVVTGDASWQDVVVSANFYDLYNGVVGLVAHRNGDNYYRFRALADRYEDTPKMALEKVVDGVVTPLAVIDTPGFSDRTWHTVTLSTIDGQISVTFDGQSILEASDATPLPGGQAGVYSRAFGGLFFDDFTVSQP